MAEMLVDSTKLDACLDAEADAIRAKTGGSADIPFDYANNKGFADAIAEIPSGGGSQITKDEWTLTSDFNNTTAYFISSGSPFYDRNFDGIQIFIISGNQSGNNYAIEAFIDNSLESQTAMFRNGSGVRSSSSGYLFYIASGATVTRYKIPATAL